MEGARCRCLGALALAAGLAAVALSIAAGPAGVDIDHKWGPFRVALFAAGSGTIALTGFLGLLFALDRKLARSSWRTSAPRLLASSVPEVDERRSVRPWAWIVLGACLMVTEGLYVWLVSAGLWTNWPETTGFLDLLGTAFVHGRTDLPLTPPEELREVAYPWPTQMRPGIPVLGDASYFDGRYYAYWGPAPAALVALAKLFTTARVGDEHMVFVGSSLVLLLMTCILIRLWQAWGRGLPGWLFGLSWLAVATMHPLLWNLNRPAIHEAAITWAQVFLLAGVLLALPAMQGMEVKTARHVLTGAMWGLALASRLTAAAAIGVLLLATLWGALRGDKARAPRRSALPTALALILPIVSCVALLGMYNAVRFGSPFETGLRYQLSVIDLNHLMQTGRLFNPTYLVPNLF